MKVETRKGKEWEEIKSNQMHDCMVLEKERTRTLQNFLRTDFSLLIFIQPSFDYIL